MKSPVASDSIVAEAPVASLASEPQPVPETETVVTVDERVERTAAKVEVERPVATTRVERPADTPAVERTRRSEPPVAERRERPVPASSPAPPAVAPEASAPAEPETTFVSAITPPVVESNPQEPAPPEKMLRELVIVPDSVLGLQLETSVSSESSRVEDRVEARVTRDVKVEGAIAVPAGARALGSVTEVSRGGKVKEQARLGIRFHTLVLADGTQLPIRTDAIYREGDSPAGKSTAKIGGAAVAGTILGAILGGKKGAVIGGAVGAAGGTAATMAGGRSTAELPAGASLTVRISEPVTVVVEE